MEYFIGLPALPERGLDFGAGNAEVHQKIFMGPMVPVRRLAGGQRQQAFDPLHIEIDQKTAVKQQVPAPAALGVAGKFQITQRQVAVPLNADGGDPGAGQRGEELPVFIHDELIGLADVGERAGVGNPQNQRVVETAGALQNRAAAGAAPQHRQAILPGLGEIDLGSNWVGVAKHEKMLGRLPDAEDFRRRPGLAQVEERLVAGEIFRRCRQCKIKKLHRVKMISRIWSECEPVVKPTARIAAHRHAPISTDFLPAVGLCKLTGTLTDRHRQTQRHPARAQWRRSGSPAG